MTTIVRTKSQLGWLNLPHSPISYRRQWLPNNEWSWFRSAWGRNRWL